MNEFLKAMKADFNFGLTENGGIKHTSTLNKVLDMFATGGAMRHRSDEDIIRMFKGAYEENPTLALRCLFYLRDIRGGQGERRFFRVVLKWLANEHDSEVEHLIPFIHEYGRYDDLFELFGTICEEAMMSYIRGIIDEGEDHLVFKWMPSINASSPKTKIRGRKFAAYFGMTEREYRHLLSEGRRDCHLVETLMSQNRWDQIAFDKLPSRAGLLYKKAFMRREETRERYAEFMNSDKTKVNAGTLNPVDIAHQIFNTWNPSYVERKAWDKYWNNLPDYYNGREEPGIAVVDVSGSMTGVPMDAAVSLGAYVAERGKGPFQNHFITFSDNPALVEFSGIDLYDKFTKAREADWGGSTNVEAVFDLLLRTARKNHMSNEDMPKTLYIFSDMEFNRCMSFKSYERNYYSYHELEDTNQKINTVIEQQGEHWKMYGYTLPRIIFWNLDARSQNIPAIGPGFSYVSGFSPVMISTILGGKDGLDLMLEKLNSDRYNMISSIIN